MEEKSTYYYRATKVPLKGYGHKHHDRPHFPPVGDPVKVGFPGTPQRGMLNSFHDSSVYVSSTPEGAHNFILENPNNIGFKWDIHQIENPPGNYLNAIGIGGQRAGSKREQAIRRTTESVKQQYRQLQGGEENDEIRMAVERAEKKPLGRKAFHEAARARAVSYVDNVARYNQEHVMSRVYPQHVKYHSSHDYTGRKGERRFYAHPRGAEVREAVARWNAEKASMIDDVYKAARAPLLTTEQKQTQRSGTYGQANQFTKQ